jgi:hypothetical protein
MVVSKEVAELEAQVERKKELISRNLQEVLGADRLDKLLRERELKVNRI